MMEEIYDKFCTHCGRTTKVALVGGLYDEYELDWRISKYECLECHKTFEKFETENDED